MIKNFSEVKTQLHELATVINSFKSEAVQLRIIELILGGTAAPEADPSADKNVQGGGSESTIHHRKVRKATRSTPSKSEGGKKRTPGGSGSVATLNSIFDDGFFKTARTIGDITKHCDVNLARKIRPNEISGKLARMVRNGDLNRNKNSDGQYQYINA